MQTPTDGPDVGMWMCLNPHWRASSA